MSLTEPKFGDVFRWTESGRTGITIMYIAPAPGTAGDFWLGLTLGGHGGIAGLPGEIAERVPLVGFDWLKWTEVPDDAD